MPVLRKGTQSGLSTGGEAGSRRPRSETELDATVIRPQQEPGRDPGMGGSRARDRRIEGFGNVYCFQKCVRVRQQYWG